jgi:hypothetical protein
MNGNPKEAANPEWLRTGIPNCQSKGLLSHKLSNYS